VEIRKEGSIVVVGEIAAVPNDTTLDARGKTLRRQPTSSDEQVKYLPEYTEAS
jgi:hypothetical protein